MDNIFEKSRESAAFIRENGGFDIDVGIILGSGLGKVAEITEIKTEISYSNIPHFPVSTVEGHEGKLIFGYLKNRKVAIMNGRFHYYEGYDLSEVVFPLRVLKMLNMKTLIVTNSAGGTNPYFEAGDIMLILDHINLLPDNPLRGKNDKRFGPRFPKMTGAYTEELIHIARESAKEVGIHIKEGVYVALQGPSLETPAEYNLVNLIGGDAVGMSTVPEVIAAAHMGIKVVGFSIITNALKKSQTEGATHEEVLEVASVAGEKLASIIIKMLDKI